MTYKVDYMLFRIAEALDRIACALQRAYPPLIPIKKLDQTILDRSVDELLLSVRAANALRYDNIKTIGDLLRASERDLLRNINFGPKSMNEIKECLVENGIPIPSEWAPIKNASPSNHREAL